MKRLAALALALAAAFPACAQRGGGHGGFSGHSAPAGRSGSAFRGSFAPSGSFRYTGGPFAHAPISYASPSRALEPSIRYTGGAPAARPSFYQNNRGGAVTSNRRIYIHNYPYYGYGYGYPSAIYIPYAGFYDNSYDDSYDNSQALQQPAPDYSYNYPPQAAPDYSYPQPPPPPDNGYAYPQPMPGYPAYPQPQAAAPQMQYAPGSAETVTLIFRDGRPPEQIQNYLATRTSLTVLDGGRRREIPLTDLDIPATTRANHEAGVDFKLATSTP